MATAVAGKPVGRLLYVHDASNNIRFLIDTGAQVSVLPYDHEKRNLHPSGLTLQAANNTKIATYGQKLLKVDLGLRRSFPFVFLIAAVQKPILGIDFLTKYGLIVDLHHRRLQDNTTSLRVPARLTSVNSIGLRIFIPSEDTFTGILHEFPSLTRVSPETA